MEVRNLRRRPSGDEDASRVFSASPIRLILGGTDDADDLRDLSELIGERDDWFTHTSRDYQPLGRPPEQPKGSTPRGGRKRQAQTKSRDRVQRCPGT